jgi:hypothetical protein
MPKRRGVIIRRVDCRGCYVPLVHAATGRPRQYCSDRCRKRYERRYAPYRVTKSEREAKAWHKADLTLRQWERVHGKFDDTPRMQRPHPDNNPRLPSHRWRLQFRISRGIPVPICLDCNHLFIHEDGIDGRYCSDSCYRSSRKMLVAVQRGMEKYEGRYHPAVDMRVRLGLPNRVCEHCGIPHTSENRRRKYCSDRCRKAAWWKRNPHLACKICSKPCKGQQTTCSDKCRVAYYRRTHNFCARCDRVVNPGSEVYPNEETRLPSAIRRGGPVRTEGSRTPADAQKKPIATRDREREIIFCTYRCRDALGWSPIRKICDECRESYYPEHPSNQHRQRFCTPQCKNRFYDRKKVERKREAVTPHYCRHCGDQIPGLPKPGQRQHYCNETCRTRAQIARATARRALAA